MAALRRHHALFIAATFSLSSACASILGLDPLPAITSDAGLDAAIADTSPLEDSPIAIDAGADAIRTDAASAYAALVLAKEPIAYYRFEESGGTVIIDSSGHGNNGIAGVNVQRAPGLINEKGSGAMTFSAASSGADNIIVIPKAAGLEPSSAISIECWIHSPFGYSGDGHIISYGYAPSPTFESYVFEEGSAAGEQAGLTVYFGPMRPASTDAIPNMLMDDVTYFIAATYDGTNAVIYINGNQIAEHALSGHLSYTDGGAGLTIGGGYGTSTGIIGTIDEVAIYPGALDAEAIAAHYQAGKP